MPIRSWDPTAWFGTSDPAADGEPDDVLQNHLGLPIYSERLRDALCGALGDASANQVEFLPVRVVQPSRSSPLVYYAANVLNLVRGLDPVRSAYEAFPADYFIESDRGQIRALRRPVLVASSLVDRWVVRLQEFSEVLFVSEQFVTVFSDNRFTGYSFVEVELSAD